jgi:hypothetical protein
MIDESDSYCAMSKTFRPWDVEQRWLLPPSVHELVPAVHVAHFVRDTGAGEPGSWCDLLGLQ